MKFDHDETDPTIHGLEARAIIGMGLHRSTTLRALNTICLEAPDMRDAEDTLILSIGTMQMTVGVMKVCNVMGTNKYG